MDVVALGAPQPWAALAFAAMGVLLVVATRLRSRGRNPRRYDPVAAWLRACAYFAFAWAVAFLTGAVSTITGNPVIFPGQTSNPWWWLFTVAAVAVIIVGYWVIWPRGTLAHGRRIVFPDTYVFGILWGISEGMIFASVWTTAVRVFGRDNSWEQLAVFVACYLGLALFIGLWHALFWDTYVAPEHNILAWNFRKVLLCHNPNVIVTTAYVTVFGNLAIYVSLQALALLGATVTMPFPSFRRPNPEHDPDAPPQRDMRGVVCVVTGIGTPTADNVATDLAELGATVVLVGGDPAGTERLAERLRGWTGRSPAVMSPVDLASAEDVRRVADEIASRTGAVDVIVDDPTGVETQHLAARHRGGVLLELLLLAGRPEGSPLRVIVVGSEEHRRASTQDLARLVSDGPFSATPHGSATVAAARVAYAMELSERGDPTRVVACAVAPGAMVGAGSVADSEPGSAANFFSTLFQSNEDPARTYVQVAVAESLSPADGVYWTNKVPTDPSPVLDDRALRDELWTWSTSAVVVDGA